MKKVELPDFNSLTVKKIKEWADSNDYKIPSGLKKQDMINYIKGCHEEDMRGINRGAKSALDLEVLQPVYADTNIDWIVHLHTYGWAVAPVPDWDPNFTDEFLSWFESCSSNFKKDDRSTWKRANLPVMTNGILKSYFGHTELQWKIREKCSPIFARIWNCEQDELLSSFDGGCFIPSIPREKDKNNSFKQWLHTDQNRNTRDFISVQGIVNFQDNGPEDGGLVLVEGSNLIFSEYMDKHPSEGIVWGFADITDPLIAERRWIKICAPPGHIILFDSRFFHCNVHPHGSLLRDDGSPRYRMAVYVCMQPRIGASAKELQKRIQLYEKGRMTTHWCYGPWFKETPEHPHSYGAPINKPSTIEIAKLNHTRRRLIGYD